MKNTILITGASNGIGRETALALSKSYDTVILADIDGSGEKIRNAIIENGCKSEFYKCDISKEDEVIDLFRIIDSDYSRLDCAANIAGIMQHPTPLAELSFEQWNTIINTNLTGTWLCMKYEIKMMQKQGSGTILNMSSLAGVKNIAGLSHYGSAKAAIIMLTKAAAKEYASSGIRVNCISPGVTMTHVAEKMSIEEPEYFQNEIINIIPQKRAASVNEIAKIILWLCSDESNHMTGQNIVVDGGASI